MIQLCIEKVASSHMIDLQKFTQLGSQIADERPVSHVRFSPDGNHLATGSWSGGVKVWNIPSCTEERRYQGILIILDYAVYRALNWGYQDMWTEWEV